jgi:signal recognition particle receptor subunit beta
VGTLDRAARSIHGKIVYAGPAGAGKTANLELLSRKLKREHRGDLKVIEGNGGTWEHLAVSLGEVRGWETSLDIWAAPGNEACESVRAELLQEADGVVFVADLRRERHEATLAALEELLAQLSAQGRSLDDIGLVIQYNHRDAADETAVEQLHRRLGLEDAVSFDSVAAAGKGVLQTLSAISKQVLSVIRTRSDGASQATVITVVAPPAAEPRPVVVPATEAMLASYEETALDASVDLEPVPLEPVAALEREWQLRSTSKDGAAISKDGVLSVPLELHDPGSGERIELRLEIRLAPVDGR